MYLSAKDIKVEKLYVLYSNFILQAVEEGKTAECKNMDLLNVFSL